MGMAGFPEFYASGGGFMHAVSVCGAFSILFALKGASLVRRATDRPERQRLHDAARTALELSLATIGVGTLGSGMGLIKTGRVVGQSDATGDTLIRVFADSLACTVSPLCWALMLVVPVIVLGSFLKTRASASE
jgi:hypothetical protein